MSNQMSVILYHPQIPENTGFIARSMNSFGYSSLRLISPEFEWDVHSPAFKTASGSQDILHQAKIFDSFESATKDTHQIIGFSRRKHSTPTKHIQLEDWLEQESNLIDKSNTALVFGPEDFGLPRDIISQCSNTVEIPQHHPSLSFNLSHAVSIVLYRLFVSNQDSSSDSISVDIQTPINQERLQLLLNIIINRKSNTSNAKSSKEKRHQEILLNYLQRSNITEDEFSVLMGYLNH